MPRRSGAAGGRQGIAPGRVFVSDHICSGSPRSVPKVGRSETSMIPAPATEWSSATTEPGVASDRRSHPGALRLRLRATRRTTGSPRRLDALTVMMLSYWQLVLPGHDLLRSAVATASPRPAESTPDSEHSLIPRRTSTRTSDGASWRARRLGFGAEMLREKAPEPGCKE
jgi:hypothetical protein